MGFCLYLALMKHIFGASFRLAVLDDVLMSVDAGHRRGVCALLKDKFPDTQFILTTHDPVWLRHMKTEGLISEGAFARFRRWDVDHGPTKWDHSYVLEEIRKHLENDDVHGAAALLRHFLEYTFEEVCHRLRAPVEYRGDAQLQLGDLMPSAICAIKNVLKAGRLAADSWGQAESAKEISAHEDALSSALTRANYEQWQTNATVHFNFWNTLGKADFAPVVEVFQELIAQFQCPNCEMFLEVMPERGPKQTLKCGCGGVSINLEPRHDAEKKRVISLTSDEDAHGKPSAA